jgi:Tfp pilus assembly protein PilF
MVQSKQYDELIAAGETRLQKRPTARTHLIMAKVYEKTGASQKARGAVEAALRLEPDNGIGQMALGALALQSATNAALVAQAETILAKVPPGLKGAKADTLADFEFLQGVCHALAGDGARAEPHFQQALKHVTKHDAARQALQCLAGKTP